MYVLVIVYTIAFICVRFCLAFVVEGKENFFARGNMFLYCAYDNTTLKLETSDQWQLLTYAVYSIAIVLFSAASRCRLSIIQQLFYWKLTFWTHQKLKFSVEAKKTERGHGLQSILFFWVSSFYFGTRKAYMQQKMRLVFVSRCYTFTAH